MPLRTTVCTQGLNVLLFLVSNTGGYIKTNVWPYGSNPHQLLTPSEPIWMYRDDACDQVPSWVFTQLATQGLIQVTINDGILGRVYQITMKGRQYVRNHRATEEVC